MSNSIDVLEWADYWPYFKPSEFRCKHTGDLRMDPEFMRALLRLRLDYAEPMVISSGYRDATHPQEIIKKVPGNHVLGIACDVAVTNPRASRLIALALAHGFTGIGVAQAPGRSRFVHLDRRPGEVIFYSY